MNIFYIIIIIMFNLIYKLIEMFAQVYKLQLYNYLIKKCYIQ